MLLRSKSLEHLLHDHMVNPTLIPSNGLTNRHRRTDVVLIYGGAVLLLSIFGGLLPEALEKQEIVEVDLWPGSIRWHTDNTSPISLRCC